MYVYSCKYSQTQVNRRYLKSRIYIPHPSFSDENWSLVGELYFVLEVVVSFGTDTAEETHNIK